MIETELSHLRMTYSTSELELRWSTFLAGIGNLCHRSLPSSCPESI